LKGIARRDGKSLKELFVFNFRSFVSRILISFARLIISSFLFLSLFSWLKKPSGKRLSKLMISIGEKRSKEEGEKIQCSGKFGGEKKRMSGRRMKALFTQKISFFLLFPPSFPFGEGKL
jgi:hypothetical protein